MSWLHPLIQGHSSCQAALCTAPLVSVYQNIIGSITLHCNYYLFCLSHEKMRFCPVARIDSSFG